MLANTETRIVEINWLGLSGGQHCSITVEATKTSSHKHCGVERLRKLGLHFGSELKGFIGLRAEVTQESYYTPESSKDLSPKPLEAL